MARKQQDSLIVAESHVGKSVVSGRRFRTEQLVARVTGEIIAEDGYGSDYCMDLGDGTVLEPDRPFCYFNHSCEPNCELVIWDEESSDPPKICVHALRPIRPGEELTLDYGWPAESAIACRCGADSCRGWIVTPEELSIVEKRSHHPPKADRVAHGKTTKSAKHARTPKGARSKPKASSSGAAAVKAAVSPKHLAAK